MNPDHWNCFAPKLDSSYLKTNCNATARALLSSLGACISEWFVALVLGRSARRFTFPRLLVRASSSSPVAVIFDCVVALGQEVCWSSCIS